jgi:hypothetical protein
MLFKKSQIGWRLLRQSIAFLDDMKNLWILPLMGRGFFFLIVTAITVFVWLVRYKEIPASFVPVHIVAIYVISLLLLGIGNMVSTYFSVALTFCLIEKQNGLPVSIKSALRFVTKRIGIVVIWILAHFVLGPFIAVFRSQFSETGGMNRAISGLTWGNASMFIPTLIANEPAGFIKTLKRSSQLLRNYAGENPKLNYSYLWVSLIARMLAVLPLTIAAHFNKPDWIICGAVISFFLLLAVVVTLNGIFTVLAHAFYQFIAHGKTLPHFRTEDLSTAIRKVK